MLMTGKKVRYEKGWVEVDQWLRVGSLEVKLQWRNLYSDGKEFF